MNSGKLKTNQTNEIKQTNKTAKKKQTKTEYYQMKILEKKIFLKDCVY